MSIASKAGRRMVETNVADKTKLGGAIGEMSGRHVIAETIPRPGKLPRLGRDFELGFEDLLVVIVARAQHHPVLAEGDRLIIVIGRDVFDVQNRHCRPIIIDHANAIYAFLRARYHAQIVAHFSDIVAADEAMPQRACWRPTSRRRLRSTTPTGRRHSCWSPITPAI